MKMDQWMNTAVAHVLKEMFGQWKDYWLSLTCLSMIFIKDGNGMANLSKEQLWKALSQPADKSCFNCEHYDASGPGACSSCHENESYLKDIQLDDGTPEYPDFNWKWNGKSK